MLPDFDPFKNVLNIKKLHDRTFLARMPNIDIIILYTGIFSDKKKRCHNFINLKELIQKTAFQ